MLGRVAWPGECLGLLASSDHRFINELSPRSSGFSEGGRSDSWGLCCGLSTMDSGSSPFQPDNCAGIGVAGSFASGRGCSLHMPTRSEAVVCQSQVRAAAERCLRIDLSFSAAGLSSSFTAARQHRKVALSSSKHVSN
jgi:hypothetical protein